MIGNVILAVQADVIQTAMIPYSRFLRSGKCFDKKE